MYKNMYVFDTRRYSLMWQSYRSYLAATFTLNKIAGKSTCEFIMYEGCCFFFVKPSQTHKNNRWFHYKCLRHAPASSLIIFLLKLSALYNFACILLIFKMLSSAYNIRFCMHYICTLTNMQKICLHRLYSFIRISAVRAVPIRNNSLGRAWK